MKIFQLFTILSLVSPKLALAKCKSEVEIGFGKFLDSVC